MTEHFPAGLGGATGTEPEAGFCPGTVCEGEADEKRKILLLARIVRYCWLPLCLFVLVGVVGVKAALPDRYEGPPATSEFRSGSSPRPGARLRQADGRRSAEQPRLRGHRRPSALRGALESGAFSLRGGAEAGRPRRQRGPRRPAATLARGARPEFEGEDPDVVVVPAMWDVGSRAPARGQVAQRTRRRNGNRDVRATAPAFSPTRGCSGWPEGHGQLGEHLQVEGRYPDAEWVRGLRYVEDGNVTMAAGVTSSGVSATPARLCFGYVGEEAAQELFPRDRLPRPEDR